MTTLHTYLPQDRLRALARGADLPDRATGAALFADISGFTPLTEALTRALGPRRGAEELTHALNRVYDPLIALVHRYGGSVINFAGDAMTCWFDETDAGAAERAIACALAMQAAMQTFTQVILPSGETLALAMKVALASGPARRWAVGDAAIQRLDVLAGATLMRMAAAEHHARRGEVIVDEATVRQAGAAVIPLEWRAGDAGARFAVIAAASPAAPPPADTRPAETRLTPAQVQSWLLPAVYARLQSDAGEFLTELRPAAALFVRFEGIDYDGDPAAGEKLDRFIQQVQRCVTRYDGAVLQLIIGDKGSVLYAAFGALAAHEDDAQRAVLAALEVRALPDALPFIAPLHLGISRGVMRVGAYGGTLRRTYGAIGDETNLAARLMQAAQPGQIVISARTYHALKGDFTCHALPPLQVKGKSAPVTAWALVGVGRPTGMTRREPAYTLPLVGRAAELALAADKLTLVWRHHGQILGITGAAGIGKSRLAAEIVRLADGMGQITPPAPALYNSACQSYATAIPYFVWRDIWRGIFRLDAAASHAAQIHTVAQTLTDIDPRLTPRAPLLSRVLDIPIPENDLTRALDAKLRKESLEALLGDCLKAQAARAPLVLVLEDLQWLDALSHDLLEVLARVSASLPVLIVLAYRPPELARLQAARVMSLPHATELCLSEFTPAEAAQFIRAKLDVAELAPDTPAALNTLLAQIQQRTQGNPFYIEELLNYMRDKGMAWPTVGSLASLDLPESLHALVLSRIDRLSETQKVTLKTASIIGRAFSLAWLHGYYPALGTRERLQADLVELAQLDLTALDTPEPELTYFFKHIVTREVAYESLPYALRAELHEQLAQFIETLGADRYLDLLAFHHSLTDNRVKQREYFAKAGDAARTAFANAAALDYFSHLLPLLDDPAARLELYLKRGAVQELLGQWAEAEADYRAALALCASVPQAAAHARCQQALGGLAWQRGDYTAALQWLAQARSTWETVGDYTRLGQVMKDIGAAHWRTGEYALAQQYLNESLGFARQAQDRPGMARTINMLGNVAYEQANHTAARTLCAESLSLARELGNKAGIANSLNTLGNVACEQGDYTTAWALHEESLGLKREVGDKRGEAASLTNLGNVAWEQGDYARAQKLYAESLALQQEMGDKWGVMMLHYILGFVAVEQQDYAQAYALHTASLTQAQAIGNRLYVVYNLAGLAAVAVAGGAATRATCLAAAAETLLAASNGAMENSVRRQYNRTVTTARAALSVAEFAATWEAGAHLTLDQAVDEALQLTAGI